MQEYAWEKDPAILDHFRRIFWENGVLSTQLRAVKKSKKATKPPVDWSQYVYDKVPLQTIPKRQLPMLFRGRRLNALKLQIKLMDSAGVEDYLQAKLGETCTKEAMQKSWDKKIAPKLQAETLAKLEAQAEDTLIKDFERQFQQLLTTPKVPAGVVMGLFNERRHGGLGLAVIDASGNTLETQTLYPLADHFRWHDAVGTIAKAMARFKVEWIALGNSVRAFETKRLVQEVFKRYPDMPCGFMWVDELGLLKQIRAEKGALSLAQRLQNPLQVLKNTRIEEMQLTEALNDVSSERLKAQLTPVVTAAASSDLPPFKQPKWHTALHTLDDLSKGLTLQGVVVQLASFGVFIDIGLNQPGLLHLSALSGVRDVHAFCRVGDVLEVRVLSVEKARRRIALGLATKQPMRKSAKKPAKKAVKKEAVSKPFNTAMADALLELKRSSS